MAESPFSSGTAATRSDSYGKSCTTKVLPVEFAPIFYVLDILNKSD